MSDFDGSVYWPDDAGYESARCAAVWNAIKPDRFPAVIVVAGTHDDVPRAVALAREQGLSIGVRSGGHCWVGNAIRNGGLLLDLSRLKDIEVDPQSLTVSVDSGVLGGELTAALAPHGLYFPSGHCPTVGVTGYTLGGGFGFNSGDVGLAAFSLHAIDVVTADGDTLHATDDDHADILWAARGSGPGFFAVVTRMHFAVRPQRGVVAGMMQIHPFSAYDQLLPWFANTVASIAPAVRPLLIGAKNPIPDQDGTVLIITAYVFADDLDHAALLLAPLEAAPRLDHAIVHQPVYESSIDEQYALIEQQYPQGLRYLGDNAWLRAPYGQDLWRDAKPVFETLPSERSAIWFIPWKPQTHPNAAFSLQSEMSIAVFAAYHDSADDRAMHEWHADALARVDRYAIGGMSNDSNLFVRPMAVLEPDNAMRLEALRSKYDPDGRFDSYPSELPQARL